MEPFVGLMFLHRYWTDSFRNPIGYQVTAIRKGWVFIRADGERKSKEKVSIEDFSKVFGKIAQSADKR